MSDLAERSTLTFGTYDFDFNSFQKIKNFQNFSHLNALGSKFDRDKEKVKVNLGP